MLSSLAFLSAQVLLLHLTPSIFANPLLINLPTLINSASINSTALPLVNTTISDNLRCFRQSPERLKASYMDCENTIMGMRSRMDTRRYIFGRGSRATFKLPRSFHEGTCHITLDMVLDDDTDRLTFAEVREAALDLAIRCTIASPFDRGGIEAVAPRKVLHITIIGTRPTDTA